MLGEIDHFGLSNPKFSGLFYIKAKRSQRIQMDPFQHRLLNALWAIEGLHQVGKNKITIFL